MSCEILVPDGIIGQKMLENARNKIIDRRRALRSRTLDFSDPLPLCGSHEPSDGLVHYSTLARKGNPRPPQFRTIQVCPKDRLTLPPAGS
jgi:hypothetical protein